jgi:hypothetical protein
MGMGLAAGIKRTANNTDGGLKTNRKTQTFKNKIKDAIKQKRRSENGSLFLFWAPLLNVGVTIILS